jgi:hypothetical protein
VVRDCQSSTANILATLFSRRSQGLTGLTGDSSVSKGLKEKSVIAEIKVMIGNTEDHHEIWSMLDVCNEHLEKYLAEALLPIVNFRRDRVFHNVAIKEFDSLFRATVWGARSVGLLEMLVKE